MTQPNPLCSICQSKLQSFPVGGLRPLLICEECRHITWSHYPAKRELAEYYERVYGRSHDQRALQEGHVNYYRDHLAFLAGYIALDRKISLLDYGSAWPILLQVAQSNDCFGSLYGVEHDAEACEFGRDNGINMLHPEQFNTVINNEAIDVIRFSHVLEHLLDPVTVLADAARKLAKGGIIYVTQPNFPLMQVERPPHFLADAVYPEHLHFFTPLSLYKALTQSGLAVIEMGAHQNCDRQINDYGLSVDFNYTVVATEQLRGLTPDYFDQRGGYPFFLGENIHAIARKV